MGWEKMDTGEALFVKTILMEKCGCSLVAKRLKGDTGG